MVVLHLRVEYARRCLDNAHSLVIELPSMNGAVRTLYHGCQAQGEVLWMHLGREAVRECLAFAGGNLSSISCCGQISHDHRRIWCAWHVHRRKERSANEHKSNILRLLIVYRHDHLCGMIVDKLDTEDLRIWELSRYRQLQVRRGVGLLNLLFDILNLIEKVSMRLSSMEGIW